VEATDPLGNQPVDRPHGTTLVEHVAAEAPDAADTEGEVELERLLEPLLLGVGHDAVRQLLGVGRRERGQVEALQLAVDADLGRRVRRQMEVGAIQLDRLFQEFGQGRLHTNPFRRVARSGPTAGRHLPRGESVLAANS
jgi:hypothetical protein